ncbi:MAG: hypothetical protein ABIJ56_16890 [Pseudomonadota bacterium]
MKKIVIIAFTGIAALAFISMDMDSCIDLGGDPMPGPEKILDSPDVQGAIADSGFQVNEGDTPPTITGSYYPLRGEITDSLHGRPAGSEIDSPGACLYNQEGGTIDYMEYGMDTGTGNYITGHDDKFTVYEEGQGATYMFSGTKTGEGLNRVTGLVVYEFNWLDPYTGRTALVDPVTGEEVDESWEYSETEWTLEGPECR